MIFWISLVLFAICIVTASILIYQVNKKTPQVTYINVKKGTTAKLETGIQMKVMQVHLYKKEESNNRYGKKFIAMLGSDANIDYKSLEIEVSLENTANQEEELPLSNIYIENNTFCTGIAPEIMDNLPEVEQDMDVTLKAKEKRDVVLTYLLYPSFFSKQQWSNFHMSNVYLADQWYPVKRKWLLS